MRRGGLKRWTSWPSCSRAGAICSTQLDNREQIDASTSTEDFLSSRDKGVEGNVREKVEAVKTPGKTSVTIEGDQTPTTSRVPEVQKVFSPHDLDPKDPITEDFYPEPVKLDPVESRQYIQCHANGRRVLAMPDTGATVSAKKPNMAASILHCKLDNRVSDVTLMRKLLRIKAGSCASFRSNLVNTRTARVIHSTHPSDRFWGSGLVEFSDSCT